MSLSIEELRHAIRIQKHLVTAAGMDEKEAYHIGIVVLENRDKIREILSDLQPIEPKTQESGSVTCMNLENLQDRLINSGIIGQVESFTLSMPEVNAIYDRNFGRVKDE